MVIIFLTTKDLLVYLLASHIFLSTQLSESAATPVPDTLEADTHAP